MAKTGEQAQRQEAVPPPPRRDCSTHFAFSHKVFNVDGAYFALDKATNDPLFHVTIGELKCAVTLPSLRAEFSIKPDSDDGKLLDQVDKGLRYVKEIRPGDSIPRQMLDGTCSWAVEERHRAIARNRLSVQLASWLGGSDVAITDAKQLAEVAEDAETKERIQKAFEEAAEKLGLGRDRKTEIIKRFETLARELAYIEALRDRYGSVRMIMRKLGELVQIYKADRGIAEEIVRIQTLLRAPDAEYQNQFTLVDMQTSEILQMLRKIDAQIAFIREHRDDIHFKFMKWDDMIAKWNETKVERGEAAEAMIKSTYRFVAQEFPVRSSWQLQNNTRR